MAAGAGAGRQAASPTIQEGLNELRLAASVCLAPSRFTDDGQAPRRPCALSPERCTAAETQRPKEGH
jgi:hypothetical protein